jgi:hypothetical protein
LRISKKQEKNASRKAYNKQPKKLRNGSRGTTGNTAILTDVLPRIDIRLLLLHRRRRDPNTTRRSRRIDDKDIPRHSIETEALGNALDDSGNTL